MSPQITRSGEVSKAGKASFVKLPIDELRVGHAGLYKPEEDEDSTANTNINDDDNDDVIEDIPLMERTGGNTVINSEKGVKMFVKELSKDKSNHLPNTETGVWVHYLTQGIKNDFNRTWEEAPKSIAIKAPVTVKSREKAKRIMTRKQKNELLAQMKMEYYDKQIASGEITLEEAFAAIKVAYDKKNEVEKAGYFLSSNKTDGVELYDWKNIVNEAHDDEDAWRVYSGGKIKVIIPNIVENYYKLEKKPKKLANEMSKCMVLLASCYKDDGAINYGGEHSIVGYDDYPIDTVDKLKKLVSVALPDVSKKIGKTHKVVGYHLVQRRWSGEMKPRYLAIDTIKKSNNTHEVFIADTDGSLQTLRQKVYR